MFQLPLLWISLISIADLALSILTLWHGWEVLVGRKQKLSPFSWAGIWLQRVLRGPESANRLESWHRDPKNIRVGAFVSVILGTVGITILLISTGIFLARLTTLSGQ